MSRWNHKTVYEALKARYGESSTKHPYVWFYDQTHNAAILYKPTATGSPGRPIHLNPGMKGWDIDFFRVAYSALIMEGKQSLLRGYLLCGVKTGGWGTIAKAAGLE